MAGNVAATRCWNLEIVKRPDVARFEVLPKRWIVERTFAWISQRRRLARGYKRHARKVVACIHLGMIHNFLERLQPLTGQTFPNHNYTKVELR